MRKLYSLVWWLILPLALIRLWWRGRKERGYREHIAERLGFYPPSPVSAGCLWIHAVSVGETRAAEPLVQALLAAYPEKDILLTCMTPTGRATGQALFSANPRITQAYLPYDTGFMMNRLIQHYSPSLCILMETEVWPNLLAVCRKNGVPVALVNARLSERSLAKGQRLPSLILEAANNISCVAAQTETDARRLRQFGSSHVAVAGSVKFDVTPSEEALEKGKRLRDAIGNRPVLMCASTRDGEEALILDAFAAHMPDDILLLMVPRHPQRFDEVATLIASRQLKMIRRSSLSTDLQSLAPVPAEGHVLLGDSMGEMFTYYAASDIAFIGGSLAPLGGQNLIEACALGKPVIIGPHTFNFEAITEDAVAAGAAIRITSAAELLHETRQLLTNQARYISMGEKARQFAQLQRGATERTLALLKPFLETHQTGLQTGDRES